MSDFKKWYYEEERFLQNNCFRNRFHGGNFLRKKKTILMFQIPKSFPRILTQTM